MASYLDPILGKLVMDALCAVGLTATPKDCPDAARILGKQNHVVELSPVQTGGLGRDCAKRSNPKRSPAAVCTAGISASPTRPSPRR
jgi:hypothetical protein